MCQLVLPSMRARGWGRIINLSSMGANFTFPGAGAYHASKYAVEALSDALRFEVADFGIGVVLVQPGLIRTKFASTAAAAATSHRGGAAEAVDGETSVYDEFNKGIAALTNDAYQRGVLARLGGEPDNVARAIEKAIIARRAPLRVRVTPSAHLMIIQRRLMTGRMWDRFVATRFPSPRRSS